jgi:hypothetical protein
MIMNMTTIMPRKKRAPIIRTNDALALEWQQLSVSPLEFADYPKWTGGEQRPR